MTGAAGPTLVRYAEPERDERGVSCSMGPDDRSFTDPADDGVLSVIEKG